MKYVKLLIDVAVKMVLDAIEQLWLWMLRGAGFVIGAAVVIVLFGTPQ